MNESDDRPGELSDAQPPTESPARAENAASTTPEPAPRSSVRARLKLAPVTTALLIVNVVVFAVMSVNLRTAWSPSAQDLALWNANFGPLTTSGEWWRLLTGAFIHGGLLHLGFNMLFLWLNGGPIERLCGSARFATIYLLGAIGASLASTIWKPEVVSCGASGALFAIVGAHATLRVRYERRHPSPTGQRAWEREGMSLITMLASSAFIPHVDNAAHIGGLVCGLGIGWIASGRYVTAQTLSAFLRTLVLPTVLCSVALAAFAKYRTSHSSTAVAFDRARRIDAAIADGDWKLAIERLDAAIAEQPDNAQFSFMRGVGRLELGDTQGALSDLDRAIELDPRNGRAFAGRAACRATLGEFEAADEDIARARELEPDHPYVQAISQFLEASAAERAARER